ncbi:hypothetical protein VaNZ11_002692, partial [Volvox africanus]
MQNTEYSPFILLSEASPLTKWQSVCSYAIINQFQAVAAAMALHPVATASAVQLAASSSSDLGHLVLKALQWSSSELPLHRNLHPSELPRRDDVDLTEYLWEATEDGADKPWKATPPQHLRTGRPSPRPPHRISPRLPSSPPVNRQSLAAPAAPVAWESQGRDSIGTNEEHNGIIPERAAAGEEAAAATIIAVPSLSPPFAEATIAATAGAQGGGGGGALAVADTELIAEYEETEQQRQGQEQKQQQQQQQQQERQHHPPGQPAAARCCTQYADMGSSWSSAMGIAHMDSVFLDSQGGPTQGHEGQKSRQHQLMQDGGSQHVTGIHMVDTELQQTEIIRLAASQTQQQQQHRDEGQPEAAESPEPVAELSLPPATPAPAPAPAPAPPARPAPLPAPTPALFDVLRMLPADLVWRNLLSRIGVREASALRLLSREWDEQVRNEWGITLRLVLGADCVRELRRRVEGGYSQSLAARYAAVSRLQLVHRRIERTIFPNTRTVGSSGLLEVPPVVVDDAPPLAWVMQSLVGELGSRLRRLHISSDSAAVSELDLELVSMLFPNLDELVICFDCHEQPAPSLWALNALPRLRRLAVNLRNEKFNYDPVPELMIRSLGSLTSLRCLSLELTASSLPLPGRVLEHLTSLRLAVVFRGYSAGLESEQLRGLVSELGYLTALRALAVPDGYRGIDGDLLRAACMVLPSLTALQMPRLSVTRDELAALARLPMLQHVTLGSLDIAPDADYEDLLMCDDTLNDKPWVPSMDTWRSFHHGAEGHASETSTSCEMASASSNWSDSRVDACFVNRVGRNAIGGYSNGAEGNGDGSGCGGNGGGRIGSRSGVLRSMTSWRQFMLCEEQRMEALVAAGPLPPGLRELRVEQLRWPRGSRADNMTARSINTLLSFCADVAKLPYAAIHLSLEVLPGAATATFLKPPSEGRGAGSTTAAAAELAAAVAAGGGRRPLCCSSVRDVVLMSCSALGQVPGLKTLRWWGLLPVLAHLDEAGISQALGNLQQVLELDIPGGLRGPHPSTSPLFLLHLARGLEAMPRLRRLRLTSTVPHNDALAQGLPGFLVALRGTLRVEVAFVSYEDAAALRNLMARSAAAALVGAARTVDGSGREIGATDTFVCDGSGGATVMA